MAADPYNGRSWKETAYAVHCPKHGKVFLTVDEYGRQLMRPNSKWTCPVMDTDLDELGLCGRVSEFDDAHFEATAEKTWERWGIKR